MNIRFGLSLSLSILLSVCCYYIYPMFLSGMNPFVGYLALSFCFALFVLNVILIAKARTWLHRMILTTILITSLFTGYHLLTLHLETLMQNSPTRRYYSE